MIKASLQLFFTSVLSLRKFALELEKGAMKCAFFKIRVQNLLARPNDV